MARELLPPFDAKGLPRRTSDADSGSGFFFSRHQLLRGVKELMEAIAEHGPSRNCHRL